VKNSVLDLNRSFLAPAGEPLETVPRGRKGHVETREIAEAVDNLELRFAEFLGDESVKAVGNVLRASLLQPVVELVAHPGKRIRGQLVRLCYRLVSDGRAPSLLASKRCQIGAEAIELIHAGSLIVDDIEDGSPMRRGRPALHVQYGIPIALNAGNWLYFWPFQLLKDMDLPDERLLLLYERYHATLLRAHSGQAIDLGVPVDELPQNDVAATCESAMKLKTGALMGFAAVIGGVVSGAPGCLLTIIEDFGRDLGVALQMFDDLGNLTGKCEPSKRYEDLFLRRPSWVWACAANCFDAGAYQHFVRAVNHLPDAVVLERWLADHNLVALTRASARAHLDRAFDQLRSALERQGAEWSRPAFNELRDLGEEIAVAYGR
jgi:geranylgeranyl pyrophosphate synthase